MTTIKSSDEHLTLNADGSSKDIKFQANGVEKASISSAGAFTSTSVNTGTIEADDKVTISYEAGSSDWELESTSGDDFTISRNSQQRLILDGSNGKLGMGIATPLQTLHLKQTARYTDLGLETTNRKYTVGVDNTTSEWYVYDDNATSFRMKIDSAGAVTIPSQPAFLAWSNANATIANNTWTDIQFATERFDTGSDFNSATGIFTAPVTGKYQINYNVRIDGIAASVAHASVQIYTSNQDYAYQTIITPTAYDSILNYHSFNGSLLVDMDANDTAKLRALINGSTGDYGGWLGTTFSAHLVC